MSETPPPLAWLAGVVLVGLLSGCSKPEPAQEPVRSVKTMTVGTQPGEFEAEYAGEVRARHESRLGFRVGGKLLERPVDVGQRVQIGQVLARLDATDYQLAAQAAQAGVQAAQTQRDLAAADLRRYSDLKAQGFVSGAELERRDTVLKAAQAGLDQAKAQGSAQTNQKAYTTLVADKGGVVLSVDADAGQVVAAGQVVVRLAADGPREVAVSVPEQKLAGLVVGQAATVRLWTGGASLQATVREVAAAADPVSRTYAVRLALKNAADAPALGATAYVTLARSLAATPALIKLPTTALLQQGQGSAVWLYDEASRTVKAQAVVVATADGNQAVIASGLQGGEQVVVAGVHVLTEGQQVTLYEEKNKQKVPLSLDEKGLPATSEKAVVVPVSAFSAKERP